MAPKKANPMEEPPAASSSEEEEEETSEEGSSSEDEEEEDTEEPMKPSYPPRLKTHKQTAVKMPEMSLTTPQSKFSSSEESESESKPDANPKPIATKPMEETPKATKSRSKPAAKRPKETEEAQNDSKRVKKKGVDVDPDEEKKPEEDTKKQLFQRLWSEDDEIAVLKGMIEFTTEKGVDPNQDMNTFYDYIKKSLLLDFSKSQLVDKIRRLKKKYENNLERGLKKGEDQTFSKPHEQKAYDLSKKFWGSESNSGVIESAAKSNEKVRKNQNQRGNNKSLAALKAELIDGEKMEVYNNKEGNGVDKSVNVKDFDKCFSVASLEEFVMNDGLDMIGAVEKAELEERWKKLRIAQLELFVQRNELITDQTKLILDALKSSGN